MAATETEPNTPGQAPEVTRAYRLLSLLACTALSGVLHIFAAVGREKLQIGSWNTFVAGAALWLCWATIWTATLLIYRWLVDEQRVEKGIDLEVHMLITVGAPMLVTWWSFRPSFALIFGTPNYGG